MTKDDIRWIQRFDSYKKALGELREAVALSEERTLSKLEEQGMIQAFEFTHELAWKCLKDFLESRGWSRASLAVRPCIRGNKDIYGSKDAVRGAFRLGIIEDGQVWMDMIKSRNSSSHTYNRETAEEIFSLIVEQYFIEFEKLYETLSGFAKAVDEDE